MQRQLNMFGEPFSEQRGIDFSGTVYETLEDVIAQAKSRILVFGAPSFEGVGSRDPKREKFLHAIVRRIKARSGNGFQYIRIIQIPEELQGLSLRELHDKEKISDMTLKHCRDALTLEQELAKSNAPVSVDVLAKFVNGSISPFILVDDHWLVVETDAVSSQGKPCIANFFILDDKPRKIMPSYEKHFERLRSNTVDLSLSEVKAFLDSLKL